MNTDSIQSHLENKRGRHLPDFFEDMKTGRKISRKRRYRTSTSHECRHKIH